MVSGSRTAYIFRGPADSEVDPLPITSRCEYNVVLRTTPPNDAHHFVVRDIATTMRLLNTGTLRIVHFPNPDTRPPYAILSHVWQGDEASYHEIQALSTHPNPLSAAPEKVRRFCAFTRAEGFEWAWLDACCIDKTSSSELSEALNSMFHWYQDAVVCYAYLHDVPDRFDATSATLDDDDLQQSFVDSAYFTRGWTLQELLAPRLLFFVSHDWTVIGTKHSWAPTIHRATGVDLEVLTLFRPLHKVSLARRMSWAARRCTTRPEDRAYSLMGIFGVNMVTLYGEGAEKAFYRLQEEILKQCIPDQSLFAWGALDLYDVISIQTFRPHPDDTFVQEPIGDTTNAGRLLAPSPDCFACAEDMVPVSQARFAEFLGTHLPPHSVETHITGFGIRVTLPLIPIPDHPDIVFLAVLSCQHSSLSDSLLCLYLGRSISAGTSPLHSVGAFTLMLPQYISLAALSARQLRRSRGGCIFRPLPPDVRRTRIVTPTIYLLHNSRVPRYNKPPCSRAFERAVRMYVAATQLQNTNRRPPLVLLSDKRVVHHTRSMSLPRRMLTFSLVDTCSFLAYSLKRTSLGHLSDFVRNIGLRLQSRISPASYNASAIWRCPHSESIDAPRSESGGGHKPLQSSRHWSGWDLSSEENARLSLRHVVTIIVEAANALFSPAPYKDAGDQDADSISVGPVGEDVAAALTLAVYHQNLLREIIQVHAAPPAQRLLLYLQTDLDRF